MHPKHLGKLIFCLVLFHSFMFPANIPVTPGTHPVSSQQPELSRILKGTAQYCEKLMDASIHFICKERVIESVVTKYIFRGKSESIHDDTSTKSFSTEYQLLKTGDRIEERRPEQEKNGRGRSAIVQSFKNPLVPYYLFVRSNQKQYRYRMLGSETLWKRSTRIVGIYPAEAPETNPPFAMAWIDDGDYSILKLKAFSSAVKGMGSLALQAGKREVTDFALEDVHYYKHLNNGVRFPSKTMINLSYEFSNFIKLKKAKKTRQDEVYKDAVYKRERIAREITTTITYGNYKFFRVTVDQIMLDLDEV